MAVWNLADPDDHGTARSIDLVLNHLSSDAQVTIQRVDADHGNVLKAYEGMGKPLDPTPTQVEKLNRESALPAAEDMKLQGGQLKLNLTPNSLVLVKVQR